MSDGVPASSDPYTHDFYLPVIKAVYAALHIELITFGQFVALLNWIFID